MISFVHQWCNALSSWSWRQALGKADINVSTFTNLLLLFICYWNYCSIYVNVKSFLNNRFSDIDSAIRSILLDLFQYRRIRGYHKFAIIIEASRNFRISSLNVLSFLFPGSSEIKLI